MSNRRKILRSNLERLNQAAQEQDATFFQTHPTRRSYTRLATADELKATHYPAGTYVVVHLIGQYHRVRAFVPPAESGRN